MRRAVACAAVLALVTGGCARGGRADDRAAEGMTMEQRVGRYKVVRLAPDLSGLTERERRMIPLLIDAARAMDEAFWIQAYGDRDALLAEVADPHARRFVEINYGPWDRLSGNEPFLPGFGPKPTGANFYPPDMTKEDLERAIEERPGEAEAFRSLYTLVRRDADGRLVTVPYREAFADQVTRAAARLREAAALADAPRLRRYLEMRADALETDDYQPSDFAWLDMRDNTIEVVIGPIETYEDQLFGWKAAFEAFILVKDRAWSDRLAKYAALLPGLQRGLPVPDEYKQETPGEDSDLQAYEAVYYAGDANAGAKTIAINLPNDEQVQLEKGTRRLQIRNAMQAKFDGILRPITDLLIVPDQRAHIDFDAFFNNVMFHEVAHGLGIKHTITGRGTVREALREQASAIEEAKADVLGLYMVTRLHDQGELGASDLRDNYVTFLGSIFRSIRFGAASAHGRANLMTFNVFREHGAFTREEATGAYRVDFDGIREVVDALAGRILIFQGDGDYEGLAAFMEEKAQVGPDLRADLDRVAAASIPVDIVVDYGEL